MSATAEEFSSDKERLIIAFEDAAVIERARDLAESYGSEIELSPALGLIYWKNWNSIIKGAIERLPGVIAVEVERVVSVTFAPDDTYFSSTYQWGALKIEADAAWDVSLGSQDVIIAVLDTGIDYSHEDLAANMWTDGSGYYGYDFWNNDHNPMDDNIHSYENGIWKANTYIYHGTHVAGIAGAVIDNGIGIAGIAQAKLMAVKVMNASGEGTDATVSQGIEYAVDHGADVICMSLGVDSTTLALARAIDYAREEGVVLVAAAGNEGSSGVSYPAAYPAVIAVGAIDRSDHKASFSNYGTNLEIMAPGTQIWSTKRGDQYQYLSGTSTAAPFLAGVTALMLSVNPALTPPEIRATINQTATDIGALGWDHLNGWGVVNAFDAVMDVAGPTATIVDYPSSVEPNSTLTITWVASGGNNLTIDRSYLLWGYSADQLTNLSGDASGFTTPHTFEADDVRSPPEENSILYLQAVAVIEGTEYRSRLVEIDVQTLVVDPFTEFVNALKKLIIEDIGVLNFAMILVAIVAVATIVATARARKRRAIRASALRVRTYPYAGVSTERRPSLPRGDLYPSPPASVPSVYIDIMDDELLPEIVEIDEGTRVVWRNRGWAPPPGISIVSGKVDAGGSHHPDGLFSSGLMIAPGEYWSCVFNKKGYYLYYISNLDMNGKVLVRSRATKQDLWSE